MSLRWAQRYESTLGWVFCAGAEALTMAPEIRRNVDRMLSSVYLAAMLFVIKFLSNSHLYSLWIAFNIKVGYGPGMSGSGI